MNSRQAILSLLLLSLLLLSLPKTEGKRFTLRGEPLWPTKEEIQTLRDNLKGEMQVEGEPGYSLPHTYNLRTGPPRPSFIIRPLDPEDISLSLSFARNHVIRVSVHSTGHHQDVRNLVDQSLLLEMSKMSHLSVNETSRTVTVGPGQSFSRIHSFLKRETGGRLVMASGAEPGVGPAGWALGGGHGRLTRLVGLGVDCLVSLKVVLPNSTFLEVSSSSHPALFRAMRGGAGSAFGVVYSLTFRIFEDPGPVTIFNGIFGTFDYVAKTFQNWMVGAPNNAGAYYILGYDQSPYVFVAAYCLGSPEECQKTLQPLASMPLCFGSEEEELCKILPKFQSYSDYLEDSASTPDPGGVSPLYLVSTALDFSDPEELATVTKWVNNFVPDEWPGAGIACSGNAILGGASREMDPLGEFTSVAPAFRRSLMAITCAVGWLDVGGIPRKDLVEKIDEWADSVLKPLGRDGWVYWNEPQHNFKGGDQEWQNAYWGGSENYQKLLSVKRTYDPENVMTCYHCVGWEEVEHVDPALCPRNCSCSNMLEEGVCANPLSL